MIRSDRGSHFANDLIKDFLDLCGTPHNLTLSFSKQENAIVERVNKEVNKHLRGLVFDKQTLEGYAKSIPFVQRIINSSVNRRTKVSPAHLFFGNKLDLNHGILTPCDGTGFSTTFLPSVVPSSRPYMWLRVLLTSRSLLVTLQRFACRVLHLRKLTHHSFSL